MIMQKRNLDFFSFDIQRTNKNKLKYKSRTCLLFFFLLCNRFVIYQCYIAHTCIKKNSLKKSMNVILVSNLNMKYLKQKSVISTPQCWKQITNCELKCMSNHWQTKLFTQQIRTSTSKKSTAYSQVWRPNNTCYKRSDLHNNCKRLLNTLTKRGYNKT